MLGGQVAAGVPFTVQLDSAVDRNAVPMSDDRAVAEVPVLDGHLRHDVVAVPIREVLLHPEGQVRHPAAKRSR